MSVAVSIDISFHYHSLWDQPFPSVRKVTSKRWEGQTYKFYRGYLPSPQTTQLNDLFPLLVRLTLNVCWKNIISFYICCRSSFYHIVIKNKLVVFVRQSLESKRACLFPGNLITRTYLMISRKKESIHLNFEIAVFTWLKRFY